MTNLNIGVDVLGPPLELALSKDSADEKLLEAANVDSRFLTIPTRLSSLPKVETTLMVGGGIGVSGIRIELLELLAAFWQAPLHILNLIGDVLYHFLGVI